MAKPTMDPLAFLRKVIRLRAKRNGSLDRYPVLMVARPCGRGRMITGEILGQVLPATALL